VRGVGGAVHEVARHGDTAAIDAARALLDETRRALYRILAGEPGDGSADEGAAAEPSEKAQPSDDATA
jgi:hypothetical protein